MLDGPAFLAAYLAPETEGGEEVTPTPRPAGGQGGVGPFAAHRWAPVILVTGLPGAEAAREAERLGAAGFLTKPYDVDALSTLVGRYVSPF